MDELRELLGVEPRFSFEKDGIKHVVFDAYKTGTDSEVEMTDDTFNWLKSELSQSDLPIVAYCHYPVSSEQDNLGYWHIPRPHESFIRQAKELRELFEQFNVLAFVSGHTHFYFNKKIGKVKYITIPSFAEDEVPSVKYAVLKLPSLNIEIKKVK